MSTIEMDDLAGAIAIVSQRVMSEELSPGSEAGHAARMRLMSCLKELWPQEMEDGSKRVAFVPAPNGGVQAVLRPE